MEGPTERELALQKEIDQLKLQNQQLEEEVKELRNDQEETKDQDVVCKHLEGGKDVVIFVESGVVAVDDELHVDDEEGHYASKAKAK